MAENAAVTLVSSDNEEFQLQRDAAELCTTLTDFLEEFPGARAKPFRCRTIAAPRLSLLVRLLHHIARLPQITREALDLGRVVSGAVLLSNHYTLQSAIELLHDTKFLDCNTAHQLLALRVAALMNGQSVDQLRTMLHAPDDLTPEEKEHALCEPMVARNAEADAALAPPPADAPSLDRSVSVALDGGAVDEDNIMACLARVDGETMRALKAVSRAWARRVRAALADTSTLAWRFNQTNEVRRVLALLEAGLERRPHELDYTFVVHARSMGRSPFVAARARRPEGSVRLLNEVAGNVLWRAEFRMFVPDLWLELARELSTEQEELELEASGANQAAEDERARAAVLTGLLPMPERDITCHPSILSRDGFLNQLIGELTHPLPAAFQPPQHLIAQLVDLLAKDSELEDKTLALLDTLPGASLDPHAYLRTILTQKRKIRSLELRGTTTLEEPTL
jgi:hypothetical protein